MVYPAKQYAIYEVALLTCQSVWVSKAKFWT